MAITVAARKENSENGCYRGCERTWECGSHKSLCAENSRIYHCKWKCVCARALGKAADLWWLVMFFCFCAEELQKQLVEQVELRKKLEREFQHLKGGSITSVFLWVKVTQTERERHAFYISVWIFKNRPCFTAKLFAGEGVFILFFSFESWIVSLNVSPQSQSFHLMWPSVLFR